MAIDDTIRSVVIAGLSQAPDVGFLAETLVNALWPPSGEDIWAEIQAKVQALINQQLNQYTQELVRDNLSGLRNVLGDYNRAVTDSAGQPAFISDNYIAARAVFDEVRPNFMSQGYEVVLLPLMAQMANLHLGLLRDGVQFGKSWGWTDQAVADEETQLQARIGEYTSWVSTWNQNGLNAVMNAPSSTWTSVNSYTRQMTLSVTDNAYYWPQFDPQTNPGNRTLPAPTREIYSDPIGNALNSGATINPAAAFPARLSSLNIHGMYYVSGGRFAPIVVGAQNEYPGELGPSMGYVPDPRMAASFGYNTVSAGISHANPIVETGGNMSAAPGYILESVTPDVMGAGTQFQTGNGLWLAMWFKFKDGTVFSAGDHSAGNNFDLSYAGHILSSVTVLSPVSFEAPIETGEPPPFDTVVARGEVFQGAVFGFRLENAY
jgi:hypothetical protein